MAARKISELDVATSDQIGDAWKVPLVDESASDDADKNRAATISELAEKTQSLVRTPNTILWTVAFQDSGGQAMRVSRIDRSEFAAGHLEYGAPATVSITAGSSTSQAHGLGEKPTGVTAYVECLTAEHGYAAGERIALSSSEDVTTSFDANNLYVSIEDSNTITVVDRTSSSHAEAELTAANWEIVVLPFLLVPPGHSGAAQLPMRGDRLVHGSDTAIIDHVENLAGRAYTTLYLVSSLPDVSSGDLLRIDRNQHADIADDTVDGALSAASGGTQPHADWTGLGGSLTVTFRTIDGLHEGSARNGTRLSLALNADFNGLTYREDFSLFTLHTQGSATNLSDVKELIDHYASYFFTTSDLGGNDYPRTALSILFGGGVDPTAGSTSATTHRRHNNVQAGDIIVFTDADKRREITSVTHAATSTTVNWSEGLSFDYADDAPIELIKEVGFTEGVASQDDGIDQHVTGLDMGLNGQSLTITLTRRDGTTLSDSETLPAGNGGMGGTTVTANPSDAAITDTWLTGIDIEGTNYRVARLASGSLTLDASNLLVLEINDGHGRIFHAAADLSDLGGGGGGTTVTANSGTIDSSDADLTHVTIGSTTYNIADVASNALSLTNVGNLRLRATRSDGGTFDTSLPFLAGAGDTPEAGGTAAVGTSNRAARADHVHPAGSGEGTTVTANPGGSPTTQLTTITIDTTDYTVTPADASETTKGVIELATAAEVTAGTDNERAVTPVRLRGEVGAQVSTAERTAGTETDVRRFTPADIHSMIDTHAPATGEKGDKGDAGPPGRRVVYPIQWERQNGVSGGTILSIGNGSSRRYSGGPIRGGNAKLVGLTISCSYDSADTATAGTTTKVRIWRNDSTPASNVTDLAAAFLAEGRIDFTQAAYGGPTSQHFHGVMDMYSGTLTSNDGTLQSPTLITDGVELNAGDVLIAEMEDAGSGLAAPDNVNVFAYIEEDSGEGVGVSVYTTDVNAPGEPSQLNPTAMPVVGDVIIQRLTAEIRIFDVATIDASAQTFTVNTTVIPRVSTAAITRGTARPYFPGIQVDTSIYSTTPPVYYFWASGATERFGDELPYTQDPDTTTRLVRLTFKSDTPDEEFYSEDPDFHDWWVTAANLDNSGVLDAEPAETTDRVVLALPAGVWDISLDVRKGGTADADYSVYMVEVAVGTDDVVKKSAIGRRYATESTAPQFHLGADAHLEYQEFDTDGSRHIYFLVHYASSAGTADTADLNFVLRLRRVR